MNADQDFLRLIGEMDGAIFSHTQWLKRLHRSLISQGNENADDLLPDAHHRCKFGIWFYDEKNDFMRDEPCFLLIDTLHTEMHEKARLLLVNTLQAGKHIRLSDYDEFIDCANHFKQQIRDVQVELIGKVCLVDHLTGAWNRYAMVQQLSRELDRMQRTGLPCSLSMMDLDHFKQVNDQHGHDVGDIVLKKVTQVVTASLRKYDTVSRFGGEEFLICLPNTDEQVARHVLDRCRGDLEALEVELGKGQHIRITASFGVAMMHQGCTIEDVILSADHALLIAKAEGRNRVVLN